MIGDAGQDVGQPSLGIDAPVLKEAGESGPALQHVVYGFGDGVFVGELGPVFHHPGMRIVDQRSADFPTDRQTLFRAFGVDVALDGEDGVDAPHAFRLDQCSARDSEI